MEVGRRQKGNGPLPFLQDGRALTQDVLGSFTDSHRLWVWQMNVGHPFVQTLGCGCAEDPRRLKRDRFHAVGKFTFVLFATCCLELTLASIHTVWLYFHNLLNSVSATVILLLSARCHTLLVHQSPLSSRSSLSPNDSLCTPLPICILSRTHVQTSSHQPWHRCCYSLTFEHPGELFCFALELV